MRIIVALERGFYGVYTKLRQAGHEVIEFDFYGQIPNLIELFRHEKGDLLFLDMGAPRNRQLDALERVSRELDAPPIVLFSASASTPLS